MSVAKAKNVMDTTGIDNKPAGEKKGGKQAAGEGTADGKLSKKELKKLEKKAAKKDKKGGNAPAAGDDAKQAKGKKDAKAAAP